MTGDHFEFCPKMHHIRLDAAPVFYFSFWVFGWGSIQIWPQKVDFWAKKWGCIQEKPQKVDFSKTWGSIQEWGCIQADTVYYTTYYLIAKWLKYCFHGFHLDRNKNFLKVRFLRYLI